MALINWDINYSVGIDLIDKQHQKLFETINNYHENISDEEKSFEKLLAYIDFHFATEELYFDKFNYEKKGEHIKAHNFYKEKILETEKEYLEKGKSPELRKKIEDFVVDWIIHHILIEDRKYTKCFIDHNIK